STVLLTFCVLLWFPVFFFYAFPASLVLHSFPTRRSSDLSIGYFRPDRWFHLRLDVLVLLDCYGDGRCRRYYWLHSVLVARYRAVDTGSVDNFITARIKSRGSSPLW